MRLLPDCFLEHEYQSPFLIKYYIGYAHDFGKHGFLKFLCINWRFRLKVFPSTQMPVVTA